MAVKISALTELTTAANDDELAIVDTSAVETKRISVTNLADAVQSANSFVDASGSPSDNQVAVFTDSDTVEGDAALTFDTSSDTLALGSGGGTLQLNQTTANYSVNWNDPSAGRTYTIVDSGENSNFVLTSGTPADNQLAVWTADGVAEGDSNLTWDGSTFTIGGTNALSVSGTSTLTGDVTFGTATQNYVLGNNGAELSIRAQGANTLSRVNLEAQTADGGDDVDFKTFAFGTAGATDTESLRVGYDAGNTQYIIQSEAAGTGSHRPINMGAGGVTDHFVLTTDGHIGFNTATPNANGFSPSDIFHVEGDASPFIVLNPTATSGSNETGMQFQNEGVWTYRFAYLESGALLRLRSTDIDGGGADGNVLEVHDGESTIRLPNAGSNTGTTAVFDADNKIVKDSGSARYKKTDIQYLSRDDVDPQDVLAIQPATFTYKDDWGGEQDAGFIANDWEDIGLDVGLHYNEDGEIQDFNVESRVIDAAQQIVLQDHEARLQQIEENCTCGAAA